MRSIERTWDYWRKERPAADPTIIDDAIARAVSQLRDFPKSGEQAKDRKNLWKLYLDEIESWLFYRLYPRSQRLEVVAFRNAKQEPL